MKLRLLVLGTETANNHLETQVAEQILVLLEHNFG